MLGTIGDKWLERLHQHVAKDLRTKGWSQNEIADLLGSTQSTISRQMQKTIRQLGATADEATIDSWGNELSQALASMGPGTQVVRQRLIVEFQFTGNHTLRFDKTLTGLDLDAGQEQRALLRRLEWAASRLDVKRIGHVIPAVGMNIASCTRRLSTERSRSLPRSHHARRWCPSTPRDAVIRDFKALGKISPGSSFPR